MSESENAALGPDDGLQVPVHVYIQNRNLLRLCNEGKWEPTDNYLT